MQSQIIFENGGQKTFVVVLKTGEEVLSCLKAFVKAERIFAAQFIAIGALSDVVLKCYNWGKKEYEKNHVREQVEVASLLGDVAEGVAGEGRPSRGGACPSNPGSDP